MHRHFVAFYSPGTFVAENTQLPIDAWDVSVAKKMARGIIERHGATPYGFRFITRSRGDQDLDSRVTAKSGMYFLGGTVETLDDVKAREPKESILVSNMECNGWDRVITTTNGWKWTQTFEKDDVVLGWDPLRKNA